MAHCVGSRFRPVQQRLGSGGPPCRVTYDADTGMQAALPGYGVERRIQDGAQGVDPGRGILHTAFHGKRETVATQVSGQSVQAAQATRRSPIRRRIASAWTRPTVSFNWRKPIKST